MSNLGAHRSDFTSYFQSKVEHQKVFRSKGVSVAIRHLSRDVSDLSRRRRSVVNVCLPYSGTTDHALLSRWSIVYSQPEMCNYAHTITAQACTPGAGDTKQLTSTAEKQHPIFSPGRTCAILSRVPQKTCRWHRATMATRTLCWLALIPTTPRAPAARSPLHLCG